MTDNHRTYLSKTCKPSTSIKGEVFLNLNIRHLRDPWCPVRLTKEEASEVIQEVYRLHDQGTYCFDVARIVSIIEQKYRNLPGWWVERRK